MIRQCSTCKWWLRENPRFIRGVCALTTWDETDGNAYPKSKAHAVAGGHEPDSAALVTVADFSCSQWEGKS